MKACIVVNQMGSPSHLWSKTKRIYDEADLTERVRIPMYVEERDKQTNRASNKKQKEKEKQKTKQDPAQKARKQKT